MRRVIATLETLGFKCLPQRHKNANGPDIFAVKNNYSYRVEIKKVRKLRSGAFQVPPVEATRRTDDLIAIVLPRYVLIEPMSDHLKCCSPKGTRGLSVLARS